MCDIKNVSINVLIDEHEISYAVCTKILLTILQLLNKKNLRKKFVKLYRVMYNNFYILFYEGGFKCLTVVNTVEKG
jgi:hypothetical protein